MKNIDMRTGTSSFKKGIFLLSAFCISAGLYSQTVYDDFEGNKTVRYSAKNGVLDTTKANPAPNDINKSAKCAMYVRNRAQKFDNIKMPLNGKLSDVANYATYLGVPPKLKMKVYTTAPVGTMVEILLGDKLMNNTFPGGTNSQYQAHTTVTGAWEELEFKFAQIPEGSETPTTGVDQITLLFNPNSESSDTYYFDDITGPAIIPMATTPEVNKDKKGTTVSPDKNKKPTTENKK
ncbi:MAG: hypothetical protein K0Q95_1023 [Bacteroidota bacterium]|jgi:hypothetical protein|nr:hypothetical protein [Bacteroidota bacterium]